MQKKIFLDGKEAQIAFAFHLSPLLPRSEATLLKDFLTDVLQRGDLESGKLKVALIGYSDVAETYADFSRYRY